MEIISSETFSTTKAINKCVSCSFSSPSLSLSSSPLHPSKLNIFEGIVCLREPWNLFFPFFRDCGGRGITFGLSYRSPQNVCLTFPTNKTTKKENFESFYRVHSRVICKWGWRCLAVSLNFCWNNGNPCNSSLRTLLTCFEFNCLGFKPWSRLNIQITGRPIKTLISCLLKIPTGRHLTKALELAASDLTWDSICGWEPQSFILLHDTR